jgi:hypothetical protein
MGRRCTRGNVGITGNWSTPTILIANELLQAIDADPDVILAPA